MGGKYQSRIDTVISAWWWKYRCPKHAQRESKYIKKYVHRDGLIYKWLYKAVWSKKNKILLGMFMVRDEILINDGFKYFLKTNIPPPPFFKP